MSLITSIFCLTALVLCSKAICATNAQEGGILNVKVAAAKYVSDAYFELLGDTKCYNTKIPENSPSPRGSKEILLLCRAFQAAGIKTNIEIIQIPNYSRALKMVELGDADIAAETIWRMDIDTNNVLFTAPIIKKNEFEKGLYALVTHSKIWDQPAPVQIKNYRAVAIDKWRVDSIVLNAITTNIYDAIRHESIFEMMQIGRIDYTLMQFTNNDDLTVTIDNLVFAPIPNVKVKMPESRHFVISKKTKSAKIIHASLNKGITIMRKSGELDEFLRVMGIYNNKTKNWKILNI